MPNLKNIRLFYVVYSKRITEAEPTRTKRINTVYPIPKFTLSWSHYLKLMRIDDPDERAFYEIESRENNWSLRGELKHQDIGQMQMYVNYYDRVVKLADENPTIGILLCHDKSDTLVEFSLPEKDNRIFASKYRTVHPSKTQLKRLISKDLGDDVSPSAANCQMLCKTHNRAKGNR